MLQIFIAEYTISLAMIVLIIIHSVHSSIIYSAIIYLNISLIFTLKYFSSEIHFHKFYSLDGKPVNRRILCAALV